MITNNMMNIEKTVRILCQRTERYSEDIFSLFYKSNTYKAFQNIKPVMLAESYEFSAYEVMREWDTK